MAGKKYKLTKKTIAKLCAAIKKGMSYKYAAQLAGISERTFHKWKKDAEIEENNGKTSGLLLHFLQSLQHAEVEAEAYHLENIRKGALGENKKTKTVTKKYITNEGEHIHEITETEENVLPNTADSKWILSRRFPERWGPEGIKETEDGHDPLKEIANELFEANEEWGHISEEEAFPADTDA